MRVKHSFCNDVIESKLDSSIAFWFDGGGDWIKVILGDEVATSLQGDLEWDFWTFFGKGGDDIAIPRLIIPSL